MNLPNSNSAQKSPNIPINTNLPSPPGETAGLYPGGVPQEIPSPRIPIPPSPSSLPQRTKKSLHLILGSVLVILFILVLVLAIFVLKDGNFLGDGQKSEDQLLLTVGEKYLYLSDVKKVADEQHLSTAIDKIALENAQAILIERTILDQEAKRQNIIVIPEQIQEYAKRLFSGSTLSFTQITQARYELLRDKFIGSTITSVEAYSVGFWIPPPTHKANNDEQRRIRMAQQREDGITALAQIETRLRNGEEPLAIGRIISATLPSLAEIVAVNGYLLSSTDDVSFFSKPQLYVFAKENENNPLFITLFALQPGQVQKVPGPEGSGGTVVKVFSVNKGENVSYEDWLQKKKEELVTTHASL